MDALIDSGHLLVVSLIGPRWMSHSKSAKCRKAKHLLFGGWEGYRYLLVPGTFCAFP